jgi:ParB family chromosome partitioning protein
MWGRRTFTEATAAGYLNHVPKAQILQALKEAGPGLADSGTEALKKGDLVATAAKRLAGTRWLPQSLRASQA